MASTADREITDPDVIEQIRNALPVATDTANGLLKAGVYISEIKQWVSNGSVINIGNFNGFLFVKNAYVWGGQVVYWVSFNQAIQLAGPGYGIGINISKADDGFHITFTGNETQSLAIVLLHIPLLNV